MRNKILVVEDDLIIALDLKGILIDLGYNPIINIVTVKQAIASVEEHNPILVLIDMKLQDSDEGTTLGQYLLEKDTIPFIYVTSYSDKITLDRANETRPHGYIVKPFKQADIASVISIVLNNYKHKNIDPERQDKSTINTDDAPYKIRKVIDYINANIDRKIEIEELTAMTPWGNNHFSRQFTRCIGVTPYQYILNRKIEKGKSLLVNTQIPIHQIAFDLGFQSYSNFCTAFKKENNTTPEVYRKMNH
jgi:AraC-like DNA-binding protein/CheY-like chemotaxis protein